MPISSKVLNAAFNEASSVGMMPTESEKFYVEACVSKFSSFRFYPTWVSP